ncbi:MAG: hypothetical protein ACEPOZ_11125 [Marinifilaceae bacterium]
MKELLESFKYLLPALVVFATAYLLIRQMLRRDEKKQQLEIFLNNQKQITPIRLQAYERLILFLERINPESLVVRMNESGMNNHQLHQTLLSTIRQEFEHNLTQQLYVSNKVWEQIRNAKETVIRNINSSAQGINPKNSSLELSRTILEQHVETSQAVTQKALETLRDEVRNLF